MNQIYILGHDEGVCIDGKGKSINIILRSIEGYGQDRRAILEVKGLEDLTEILLSNVKTAVELVDGIKIGMPKSDRPLRQNSIRLFFSAPDGYTISQPMPY